MIAFHAALAASQPEPPAPAKSRLTKIGTIFVGVLFVAICGLQLGLSSLYAGKIYPGVSVADQKVGGLTLPAAESLLSAKAASYQLALSIAGKPQVVKPSQVGVSYDAATTAQTAYRAGRQQWFVPLGMIEAGSKPAAQPVAYTIDRSVEQQFVATTVAAVGQAPVNAQIQVVNGTPQVIPDKNGFTLNGGQLDAAITTSFTTLSAAPVVMQPSTQPARIQAKDTAPAVDKTKQLLALPVTLTYESKTFTPTPQDKGAWLTFTPTATSGAPGLTPTIDPVKVATYINKAIAPSVKVAAVTQRVNVENGVSTQVTAGVNGLAVDATTLAQTIADNLNKASPVTAAVPTEPVAFTTQYNRTVTLNYDRYIEINLSQQHLWVYQDHQVIYDSPITSGATGAGFGTAQGLFSVQAKETNRHLIGNAYGPRYDYDVFVQYWMPFYEGYGMHDASWRNGNFGGQDYYYGGSHGCVNLPLATAAWLYNWVTVGTPVWVHT